MTNIDPQADIELDLAGEHVTAKVSLDGAVTSQWLRYYQELALTAQVSAKAEALDDRAWLVVSVPASSGQAEVSATMDGARALIAEADAAAERPTNSPTDLLETGFLVWFYTIIAFAFLYWTLDGGGPESRFLAPPQFPDLAFPAQLNPGVAAPGWRPEFFDYLYLAFTNATAFSPTDVMPLARWAKLAMTVQAVGSLMILGLVIARAVNILK